MDASDKPLLWPAWSGVLVSTSLSKLSSRMEAVLGSFSLKIYILHYSIQLLVTMCYLFRFLSVPLSHSFLGTLTPWFQSFQYVVASKNFGKMEFKRCLGWALWHSGLSHYLGCSYCISEYLGVNLRSALDSC